jgi:hypothetical protein
VTDGSGMRSASFLGRLMPIAMSAGARAVRPRERMNSPLENREARLRARMNSPLGRRNVRLRERMNSPLGRRNVRLRERMNSPLGRRNVRLRGLGGPAAYGVPRTCASAAGGTGDASSRGVPGAPRPGRLKPRLQGHEVRLRGLGGPAVYCVPRTCASAAGVIRQRSSDPIGNGGSVVPRERRAAFSHAKNRGATEESSLGLLVTGRSAPALAATVRAGGLRALPAANSFAPGGGLRTPSDARISRDAAGRGRALPHSRTNAPTHACAGVAS